VQAWVAEDAFITFRTVDNLRHGYGLRWNVAERVQTYTHPLWLFLVAAVSALTDEYYFSTLALSLFVSGAVVFVFVRQLGLSSAKAALALLLLSGSASFTLYSTSGLENPLSHLLLLGVVAGLRADARFGGRAGAVGVLMGLLACCRLDSVLLLAPVLALAIHRASPRERLAFVLGTAPLWAWCAFALLYYGSALPNTAHAKLLSGAVSPLATAMDGLRYALETAREDPVSALVLSLGLAAGLCSRERFRVALAIGVLVQGAYIVRVGGDYMVAGRFFSGPVLVCAYLAARSVPELRQPVRVVALLSLMTGVVSGWISPLPELRSVLSLYLASNTPAFVVPRRLQSESWLRLCAVAPHQRPRTVAGFGLAGEGRYSDVRELQFVLPVPVQRCASMNPWRFEGLNARAARVPVVFNDDAGMFGFFAGPRVHVVDDFALTDPLLARLPAVPTLSRPGHLSRTLPRGYGESLASGENRIRDPRLARFYDQLRLVTRGPLWSAERLSAVLALNLGRYDQLLRDVETVRTTSLSALRAAPAPVSEGGLLIDLERSERELSQTASSVSELASGRLELQFDNAKRTCFELTYYSLGFRREYEARFCAEAGLATQVQIPTPVAALMRESVELPPLLRAPRAPRTGTLLFTHVLIRGEGSGAAKSLTHSLISLTAREPYLLR
jgi:arabinofuranosyltransferase